MENIFNSDEFEYYKNVLDSQFHEYDISKATCINDFITTVNKRYDNSKEILIISNDTLPIYRSIRYKVDKKHKITYTSKNHLSCLFGRIYDLIFDIESLCVMSIYSKKEKYNRYQECEKYIGDLFKKKYGCMLCNETKDDFIRKINNLKKKSKVLIVSSTSRQREAVSMLVNKRHDIEYTNEYDLKLENKFYDFIFFESTEQLLFSFKFSDIVYNQYNQGIKNMFDEIEKTDTNIQKDIKKEYMENFF